MQALWMVLAAFCFAAMGVCVKFASAWFNAAELVFWRGLLGMGLMWLLARHQGVSLATRYPGMHAWRSAVGVTSMGAWFYAIGGLPLATAMTLNYMSSVWIAAFLVGGSMLAWNPRKSPPLRQGPLVLAILAGFAGVVLMLRPTLDQNQAFHGMVGVLGGLVSAFAYLQVMALGRLREPEVRIVFYFTAGSVVGGLACMPLAGVSPWDWGHAVWLLPIALLAALGQWCMTRAYSAAATLVVASLQYFGIVFGALFGVVLFGDRIPPSGWLGMTLIVGSGIAATALRSRAAPNTPAEDH